MAHSIGVLDIFGFENFKVNSFAQLCINLTNERLHGLFIHHVFEVEQNFYKSEDIEWTKVDVETNQPVIDLIQAPKGTCLFSFMNDACAQVNEVKDETVLQQINEWAYKPPNKDKTFSRRKQPGQFMIHHYAGEVIYHIMGFVEKNKDSQSPIFAALIEEHTGFEALKAIAKAFRFKMQTPVKATAAAGAKSTKGGKKGGGARQKTVCESFGDSLQALMTKLGATEHHYIRCLKPNQTLCPGDWDSDFMIKQLAYSGTLEVAKVRKAGLNVREPLERFFKTYKICCIQPDLLRAPTLREQTKRLLEYLEKVVHRTGRLAASMPDEGQQIMVGATQVSIGTGEPFSVMFTKEEGPPPAAVYGTLVKVHEDRGRITIKDNEGEQTTIENPECVNPNALEDSWRVGRTIVFLRTHDVRAIIDAQRGRALKQFVQLIWSYREMMLERRNYRDKRSKVIKLQAVMRQRRVRLAYKELRAVAIRLQQVRQALKERREFLSKRMTKKTRKSTSTEQVETTIEAPIKRFQILGLRWVRIGNKRPPADLGWLELKNEALSRDLFMKTEREFANFGELAALRVPLDMLTRLSYIESASFYYRPMPGGGGMLPLGQCKALLPAAETPIPVFASLCRGHLILERAEEHDSDERPVIIGSFCLALWSSIGVRDASDLEASGRETTTLGGLRKTLQLEEQLELISEVTEKRSTYDTQEAGSWFARLFRPRRKRDSRETGAPRQTASLRQSAAPQRTARSRFGGAPASAPASSEADGVPLEHDVEQPALAPEALMLASRASLPEPSPLEPIAATSAGDKRRVALIAAEDTLQSWDMLMRVAVKRWAKVDSYHDWTPPVTPASKGALAVQTMAREPEVKVLKQGFLLRRMPGAKGQQLWGRRYFVLTEDGRLQWFCGADQLYED